MLTTRIASGQWLDRGDLGPGAGVVVLITSSDGDKSWLTVGASANIIEASWIALRDSLNYHLFKSGEVVDGLLEQP